MSTRYINPATGNDANDGLTPATAWQTVTKLNSAVAEAANGITRILIDTSAAPLVLTAQLLLGPNASGVELGSATDAPADLRGFKVLAGPYVQHDAVNYPNVWSTADTQTGAVIWEDRKWYDHVRGSSLTTAGTVANQSSSLTVSHASVQVGLQATPGSFWTDGTTLYFHPLGSTNPNSDGKVYERSRNYLGTGASAVFIQTGGVNIHDLRIGGTALARSTDGDAYIAYPFQVEDNSPAGQTSRFSRLELYYGGKHGQGDTGSSTNATHIWTDINVEQCTPYTGFGGQTAFVSYNGNAAATGNIHRYIRCTCQKNAGLPGSAAGQVTQRQSAFTTHNNGTGVQFAELLLQDCVFPGMGVNQSQALATSAIVRGGRVGFGGVRNFVFDGVYIDHAVPAPQSTADSVILRNCVIVPAAGVTSSVNIAWFRQQGNTTIELCTIDVRTMAAGAEGALMHRFGALTMLFRNNVFIQNTVGTAQRILRSAVSTDTLTFTNNTYQLASGEPLIRLYNDGSTNADRSLSQWQALGQDAGSGNVGDAKLNARHRPAPDSPAIGAGANLGPQIDRTGRTFSRRDDCGAYEFSPAIPSLVLDAMS